MDNKTANPMPDLGAEDLLDTYLSMPSEKREQRFVDTMHAARMTSLSVRTIQLWIECGLVKAIIVGRKYRVDLDSLRAYLKSRLPH